MKNKKKLYYIGGGILGLLAIVAFIRFGTLRSYRSEIPRMNETLAPTSVLQEQIGTASRKARRIPSSKNLGQLGKIHHASANYQEAAECYRLAIARDETQWEWSYYLGYLSKEMGRSEEAIAYFTSILEGHPDNHLAWYYLGEEYWTQGKYSDAEAALRMVSGMLDRSSARKGGKRTDQYPLGVHAQFQLARIFQQTGRDTLALQGLHSILLYAPTFGSAYRLLGNIYKLQGDTLLADRYGVRANDQGHFAPPVDSLLDRLSLISRSENFLLKKIDEAVNSINPDWALELIDQGLIHMPGNKDLLNKAMKVWMWLDMKDRARTNAPLLLELFQDDYQALVNSGFIFLKMTMYTEAIYSLERAMDLKPGDIEATKYLASAHWLNGDRQKSYALLDQIINTHPDDFDVLSDVTAFMFFTLGERNKSIQYLVVLDHFYGDHAKVQKMSAWVAATKGDFQSAIALYFVSFLQDPEDMETCRNLEQLLSELKLWEEALHFYKKVLEVHPNDAYFLERLGALLITCPDTSFRDVEQGKELAERAFLHYKALPQTTIAAGRSLTLAYMAMGERKKAAMVLDLTLQKAERNDPGPEKRKILENLARELKDS